MYERIKNTYICAKFSPGISLPIVSLGINVTILKKITIVSLGINVKIVNKITIIKKKQKIIIKFLFAGRSFFIENFHTYVFLDRL